MDDFDKWNEIKKVISSEKNRNGLRVGEVRWCKFGINVGFEIRGKGEYYKRPVLVIKKFTGDVFLGAPITTKQKDGDWYHYLANSERTVILNQVRTLDKKRLEHKLFEVSEGEIAEVIEKLCTLVKS